VIIGCQQRVLERGESVWSEGKTNGIYCRVNWLDSNVDEENSDEVKESVHAPTSDCL